MGKRPMSIAVRPLLALLATAALVHAGCGDGDGGDTDARSTASVPTTSTSQPQQDASALTLQMEARNNSGQDGTATLTTADGQTRVALELANSPSGPQPSHINAGSCEDLGDIAHILGGMRNGMVEATVDVSLDALLSGTFSVSVAKSPQEFGVTVSCAEIARI
jgi:hypothetical protein